MDNERLEQLFWKYIDDTISEAERQEFYKLVAQPQSIKLLRKYSERINDYPIASLPEDITSKILSDILSKGNEQGNGSLFQTQFKYKQSRSKKRKYFGLIGAVAIVMLFLFIRNNIGGDNNKEVKFIAANQVIKDAMPGHPGAVLTLSNGKSYLLDTAKNGMLQPGIKKSDNGISLLNNEQIYYATLETPYGSSQKLTLSDGTLVWLNAGSSIRFPSRFVGEQRKVEITGEAYFEVVHNEKQPFIVLAGNDKIMDLGTHFDVRAYCDEDVVKTTLLEGSVQIGADVLKPGQQYVNGQIKNVNAQAVISWVSGFFHFENADIKEVMHQLSRWYNVQVEYAGVVPNQRFEGEMQRSLKLSQVLNLIAGTGIHYTLDGNKLTVRP